MTCQILPVRILIVDDDEMILKVLSSIIEKKLANQVVVHTEQAHCANDAIISIAETKPDIVLLDHTFDKNQTNGLDVIEGVKKNGMAKYVKKIISITSDETVVEKYLKLGIERINKLDFQLIIIKIISFINNCIEKLT